MQIHVIINSIALRCVQLLNRKQAIEEYTSFDSSLHRHPQFMREHPKMRICLKVWLIMCLYVLYKTYAKLNISPMGQPLKKLQKIIVGWQLHLGTISFLQYKYFPALAMKDFTSSSHSAVWFSIVLNNATFFKLCRCCLIGYCKMLINFFCLYTYFSDFSLICDYVVTKS